MKLDEVIALARAALDDDRRATPAPLTVNASSSHRGALVNDTGEVIAEFWCGAREGHGRANAEWFAVARTREPALARWIERVAPAIERLRTCELDRIGDAIDALLAAAESEP